MESFDNAASCWKTILSDVKTHRGLLAAIEKFARESNAPAKIVFGTSGWRGEIGTDFTFHAVRVVTSALIEVFRQNSPSFMKAMGVSNFEEIRTRGIIVGHDNRFLGPEFSMEVIGLLQKEGIKTWYAGEAPTPAFSAGIEMLRAACSINLTPSHNPANYAGFKLNPSDGGPAGQEITSSLESCANAMMDKAAPIHPESPATHEKVDLTDLYIRFLKERRTLSLKAISDFIERSDCILCVDNMHGATRGCIERIVGPSPNLRYLRTENDFLFGGVSPEPSVQNMSGAEKMLRASPAAFKLAVIMDPDGDRIRYSDGSMQIPMNYFGAMALHFLYVHKGIRGVAVKSVGTSNFVNAIAAGLGVPVRETKVGFKNFRPYMLDTSAERAIVAFEESDGISAYNHTLEKDALFGFLLAVEMMAVTGKNLGTYLKDLMDEFGYYYPDRSGISVDPSLAGESLLKRISKIREVCRKGTEVKVGKLNKVVKDVITVDGTKLVFDDGSWLMIRPSGTEPKVRFYIEARTAKGKKALFETAERMTREAIGSE